MISHIFIFVVGKMTYIHFMLTYYVFHLWLNIQQLSVENDNLVIESGTHTHIMYVIYIP
jgi:hypothetical protein